MMDSRKMKAIVLQAYQDSCIEFESDMQRRLAVILKHKLQWPADTGVPFAEAMARLVTNAVLKSSTSEVHRAVEKELG